MTRNLIHLLIPAATALFLLASCSGEELGGTEMPPQTDSPQEIRFEMAYATPAAAPDNGTPGTRVVTSNDSTYTNTWEDGDEVGVFIVKGDAALQRSGNWVDNMKMTFRNGKWDYTLPAGKEYYPEDEPLSFYAYYPYQENWGYYLTITLPPTNYQDGGLPHVFIARTKGVYKRSEAVRLEFSSPMAMVEVSLKSGGDGGRLSDGIVTKIMCYGADVDLETGTLSLDGALTETTFYRVQQPGDADYRTRYTYRALVPPQTLVSNNTNMISFVDRNVPLFIHLVYWPEGEGVVLEAGQVKSLEITLKPALDPSHEYNVGDIYPHKGWPMGVVYETWDNGRHGRIAYYEHMDTTWGKDTRIEPNYASGKANMKAVYEVNGGSFDGFPPFQWADGLNPPGTEYTDDAKGIWYIPAREEARKLCQNEFITAFNSYSRTPLPEERSVMIGTSTSVTDKLFSSFSWNGHDSIQIEYTNNKQSKYYFFAVMEF